MTTVCRGIAALHRLLAAAMTAVIALVIWPLALTPILFADRFEFCPPLRGHHLAVVLLGGSWA